MIIKFSKLNENAVIPSQAKPGDAGVDLTAISYNYVHNAPVPFYNYEFGLAVEIPAGWVGLIFPRSSISNKDLMLTNCVGVIDSGYRGALSARFKVTHFKSEMPTLYKVGERIAQLVLVPCPEVMTCIEVPYSNLTVTERGTGSFGSSGA